MFYAWISDLAFVNMEYQKGPVTEPTRYILSVCTARWVRAYQELDFNILRELLYLQHVPEGFKDILDLTTDDKGEDKND